MSLLVVIGHTHQARRRRLVRLRNRVRFYLLPTLGGLLGAGLVALGYAWALDAIDWFRP